MERYVYGMRLRGFSPMCQPMDGLIDRLDDDTGKYHDILEYDRPLTDGELKEYELDYIKTYESMEWREFIEAERKTHIGRKVRYKNEIHTVVDVDYNGVILIDKPAEFTPETAIGLPKDVEFVD